MRARRPWQEALDTPVLERMAAVGYTDAEIGAVLDRPPDVIQRQRKARQIECCHRVDWTKRRMRERIAA